MVMAKREWRYGETERVFVSTEDGMGYIILSHGDLAWAWYHFSVYYRKDRSYGLPVAHTHNLNHAVLIAEDCFETDEAMGEPGFSAVAP